MDIICEQCTEIVVSVTGILKKPVDRQSNITKNSRDRTEWLKKQIKVVTRIISSLNSRWEFKDFFFRLPTSGAEPSNLKCQKLASVIPMFICPDDKTQPAKTGNKKGEFT